MLSPTTAPSRQLIIDEARSYIGCPFKHQGRARNGIDCVGLIVEVGKKFKLHDYPDDIAYTRQSVGAALLKPFLLYAERIELANLKDGDILIVRDPVFPQHVGFWVDRGGRPAIIHSTVYSGKVTEEIISPDLNRRIIMAFKFKGLD
jgi:cell wall-associated NlpC family hydrolase